MILNHKPLIFMKTYTGKIILKSGGMPIQVQISATNKGQATRAIEAQFADQIKAWAQQMVAD